MRTLLLLIMAFGLSNTFAQSVNDHTFELEIEGIYDYGSTESFLVRLIEKDGDKGEALDMIVGGCEATALARTKYDWEFSRPLTYDLFNSVFENSSLKLSHIVITKLEEGTFYAVLVVDDNGKEIELDARPSDSINLALKAEVPIYATEDVWNDAAEEIED
jgi:bifunctional DNase/RNase